MLKTDFTGWELLTARYPRVSYTKAPFLFLYDSFVSDLHTHLAKINNCPEWCSQFFDFTIHPEAEC